MPSIHKHLGWLIAALLLVAGLAHGPVAQWPNYHDFADQAVLFGVPHAGDVLSNLGFAAIALWAGWRLVSSRRHPALAAGWGGYRLFVIGLALTACGSAFYHLAPDNARLVWDRLPITLTCAGLLAGVWGDCRQRSSERLTLGLAVFGVVSVGWWSVSGDLRPYLLLQILPLCLIPLWQWQALRPAGERWAFAGALLIYAFAKLAEVNDHPIAAFLGAPTGHTLKHLLATAAAALIVASLACRVRS